MEFFRQLGNQLRAIYRGLSWQRRAGLIGAAMGLAALAIGLAYYASRQEYRPLFSGLSPEDAGAVTAKLQSRGTSFRLGAGGSTVLVPADQVAQLRLDLAVEGLPAKAKGYELFDEINIGMTPFQQHVNFDRALQTELAKTISQIDPVVAARVHLARPDPTPFVREQKPATASVVLRLRPGASLGRKTAEGITALVARSVEGLAPEQVTLLDTNGRLLSGAREGQLAGPVSSQLDSQRETEAYLSARAEEMLARLLGPGRAVVRVTAEMEFKREKTRRESYDPDGRVLAREAVTARKANSTAAARGGPAGTGSNLPGASRATPVSAGSPNNSENEEVAESEWRVSKVEQELEESRGAVKRLTIAAMVDLSRPEGAAGRSPTAAEVEEIVKQATGFKRGRDEIKVSDVKLAGVPADEPAPEGLDGDRWGRYMVLARNVSLAVALLVGAALGFQFYRGRRSALVAGGAPTPPVAQEAPAPAPSRLAALAEADPEGLARLLAAWIDEAAGPGVGGLARAA